MESTTVPIFIAGLLARVPKWPPRSGRASEGNATSPWGNVVGSNIFNIPAVLGLAALVAPDGLAVAPSALSFDLPIMLAVVIACLPAFFTGCTIARWEGWLFLIAAAAGYRQLESITAGLLVFVLPPTAVALGVTVWRAWKGRARSP